MLVRYWHTLKNAYGLGDEAKLFCLIEGIEVENQAPTLQALQDWVKTDGKGQE
jgi:hypothetical protein